MRALPSRLRRSLPRGRGAVVAVAAIVLVASLLPVPVGDGTGAGPLGVDLAFHAVGYAALAAVALATLEGERPGATDRNAAVAFAASTGFGLLVELLQGTIPWRTMAAADAVANAIGAALAVLALRAVASE